MTARRARSFALALAGLVFLAGAGYYFGDYMHENQALDRFMHDRFAVAQGATETDVVGQLTAYLGSLPGEETTARVGYLNPLYRFLKARPEDVLQYGGFCGNKARLLVTLLKTRGIEARVMYVFNPEGWTRPDVGHPYVTAIVEVGLGGRWVIADPYIGTLFRRGDGLPAAATDLAADPALVRAQAPSWYSSDFYNYRELRGIRWCKFPLGERVHDLLGHVLSPASVNAFHYPWWAQRPNLLIALAFGAVSVVAFALALRTRGTGVPEVRAAG
jgi:transglutaminase superfamily protein